MMKQQRLIGVLSLCASIAVLFGSLIHFGLISRRRQQCRSRLSRSLHMLVWMYEKEHGAFPSKMTALETSADIRRLFVCGERRGRLGPMSDVDEWMDYIYVYWPTGEKTPKALPLMYDRRMSNHRGKGVNVVLVGSSSTGPGVCFWDRNAEWLKKFDKEHPNVNIPLPEE